MGIYRKQWGIGVFKSDEIRGNYIEKLKLNPMTKAQAESAIANANTTEKLVIMNLESE